MKIGIIIASNSVDCYVIATISIQTRRRTESLDWGEAYPHGIPEEYPLPYPGSGNSGRAGMMVSPCTENAQDLFLTGFSKGDPVTRS